MSRAFALAMLVTLTAAAAPRAGLYEAHQMEMAAALELKPDGHFRYGLTYGALDETAEGGWREADGRILLTTAPAVVPPRFALVSDTPSVDGAIYAALDKPDALGDFTLTLAAVDAADGKVRYVEADETGRVPIEPGREISAIVPDLPVYQIPFSPYKLTPGGHRLVFRFDANDLGKADFKAEALTIDGDALVLKRFDRTIRFERASR